MPGECSGPESGVWAGVWTWEPWEGQDKGVGSGRGVRPKGRAHSWARGSGGASQSSPDARAAWRGTRVGTAPKLICPGTG